MVRQVSAIERISELPRVMQLCAARSGQELNVTRLAHDLSIPPRTLDGYLALLANVFVLQLIPAWSTNLSSKVIRRAKLVMVDSGLASHLTGLAADRIDDPTTRVLMWRLPAPTGKWACLDAAAAPRSTYKYALRAGEENGII